MKPLSILLSSLLFSIAIASSSAFAADANEAESDFALFALHPHRYPVHHHHNRRAHTGSTYLRIGAFNPTGEELGNGAALGLEFAGGSNGRLEFGFAVDYYRNTVEDPGSVFSGEDEFGHPIQVIEQGDSYTSNHMPLLFTGRYFLPVLSETAFNPYLSGGLGYGIVWTVEEHDGDVSRDLYGGFAWQAGGGAGLHLTDTVSLIGELRYAHNVVSQRERVGDKIYITRVDLSGASAWIGLRFGL
jgi:opacity protein-like surface antigen